MASSADCNCKFSEHILSTPAIFKATSKLFGPQGCSDEKKTDLSRPPRQLGDIHILNFATTQGKVNSPWVTRGEGCLGFPRP